MPLARHFLSFYGGIDGPRLAPDAEAVLATYGWPGNVRELENVMKRIAALHASERPVSAARPDAIPHRGLGPTNGAAGANRVAERDAIVTAWRDANGNKSRLAQLLGVSRKTLYARLQGWKSSSDRPGTHRGARHRAPRFVFPLRRLSPPERVSPWG